MQATERVEVFYDPEKDVWHVSRIGGSVFDSFSQSWEAYEYCDEMGYIVIY